MIGGFNTNIRHRGVLFHVQTEDSGLAKPHIITHLYHGGNIMHSQKTSYAEHLESEDVTAAVKKLMEQQHKAKLKALRRGEFDDIIRERLGPDTFMDEEQRLDATTNPEIAKPTAEPRGAETQTPTGTETSDTRETEKTVPRPLPPTKEVEPEQPRVFGEGIVSDKPLDELVLGYLVDNARKRKKSDP